MVDPGMSQCCVCVAMAVLWYTPCHTPPASASEPVAGGERGGALQGSVGGAGEC